MSTSAQKEVAKIIADFLGPDEAPPSEVLLRARLAEILGPEKHKTPQEIHEARMRSDQAYRWAWTIPH